jgi:Flp pilus assembly protein TadD
MVVGVSADGFRAAHSHYEAGRLTKAEEAFLKLLTAHPAHSGALYFLGAIAYQQGSYAVAGNYFRQAVAVNPQDGTFHSGLGAAQQALGRFAEALLCHQQARTLHPDDSSVLNNMGITLGPCETLVLNVVNGYIYDYNVFLPVSPCALRMSDFGPEIGCGRFG